MTPPPSNTRSPRSARPERRRSAIKSYVIATGAVAAAVLLRLVLDPVLGDTLPFVTLFGAVAAAVWAGGSGPGTAAAVVGYMAAEYLFIPPRDHLLPRDTADLIGMGAYLFTCGLIIAIGRAMRAAAREARDRREVLQVTLRSIGDAVITTGIEGRVTYLNEVAESLTGWRLAEAVGQPLDRVFAIVNEDTRQPVESPATRALREGTVVGLANHTVLLHKDGGERPIDDSAAPIRDDRGEVTGCVLIFRDVSTQREVERDRAAQLVTARVLAAIVETSDDAIISKGLDGVVQSWNASAERLFGYTAAEAVGRHISLVIPPDRLGEEDRIIASLKAGQRIDHFETERMRKDGDRVQVALTVSPIKDADGRVVGASKIVREIGERKRAEAERQKFVTLVENSRDFIGICDLDGVPSFVNRAGLELVGLDDVEAARRTSVREFFFPEDQPRIMGEFFESVLANGHGEVEVRFRNFKTGAARWMAYEVLTLTDETGKPVAFATVSQDMTERKALEDDLRRLAADLSETDRRKDEFLAMLAHELRSPLAPISNAVQILRRAGSDGAAVLTASDMLERQVAQMSRLVDDLLDMGRITRGRIELRKERIELATVLNQAIESARALYRAMGHELSVTLPMEPLYLDADAARLAQVIGNLLNNACKFTDAGGHIRLGVERHGGQAVIRVRDNGIGIAPEHLPRLFAMFSQVDTSLERTRDGLGIGLTLVKNLVEMHGGTVEAHSEGLGRGSEFVVRLPLAVEAPRPAPAVPESRAATGRRILIADDNEDGAESLSLLLRLNGHETHVARDGLGALEAAERLRPDVVLLDIGMPRMSGYDVCRRLRSEPWGRDLTIVAVTGWGQDDDRLRSKEAGFDAHVVKPVDPKKLMKLLETLRVADEERLER